MTINESIILSEFFYNSSFTDITLLQIFIFLAVPYIILYWFKEFTEFDNFTEKWEGALFIFFFGFLSYILTFFIYQYASKFILSYFLSLILICLLLYLSWKFHYSKKDKKLKGKLLLKNKDNYYGIIREETNYYLVEDKKGIIKYSHKTKKEIQTEYKSLGFKKEDVDKILIN